MCPAGTISRIRRAEEGPMTGASTHPPLDPELRAALAVLPPELRHSLLPGDIPAWREQIMTFAPDDEALRRDGAR
jgi:hypothetical protein